MTDLIDTTEMYLRTIYELEEEGIVPLRARIAERLHQSGPTVSQTVGRMERDGLLTVEGDRHLELTDKGRQLATRVMRKHRLAERLLTDVIGLELGGRPCRGLPLGARDVGDRGAPVARDPGPPTVSPYGNPIPGLDELGDPGRSRSSWTASRRWTSRNGEEQRVIVGRIAEPIQTDPELMSVFRRVGAEPGKVVTVGRRRRGRARCEWRGVRGD